VQAFGCGPAQLPGIFHHVDRHVGRRQKLAHVIGWWRLQETQDAVPAALAELSRKLARIHLAGADAVRVEAEDGNDGIVVQGRLHLTPAPRHLRESACTRHRGAPVRERCRRAEAVIRFCMPLRGDGGELEIFLLSRSAAALHAAAAVPPLWTLLPNLT